MQNEIYEQCVARIAYHGVVCPSSSVEEGTWGVWIVIGFIFLCIALGRWASK